MKEIIVLFSLLCMSLPAHAQLKRFTPNESTRLVIASPVRVKESSKAKTTKKRATSVAKPAASDHLLYRNIVRRYSWIEGVGKPLTQEEANHLPFYYKLSLKNDKGHWQHIQAMHGNSMTTQHNAETYIINTQYDDAYNLREWRERFSKVCQWYITSDLSGENVAEERAYDKDGYMVYGFQPVRNGDNRVVASYTDGYGYPIEIDESQAYMYGNVVMITYDGQGRDSIVDYLDGAGLRRANNDGVDQRRYEYDSQGRIIRSYSCNAVGDKVIDNWGNCGSTKVYEVNGTDYVLTITDAEGKPMRMPARRVKNDTETFVSCRYRHDKWGRLQERVFLDGNGKPDKTLNGVHRIVYHYSDQGAMLSEEHYDLENRRIKNR